MNEIYSQYSGTLKQLSWVLAQTRNLGSSAHSKHANIYTGFYKIQKSTPLPSKKKILKIIHNIKQTNSRCLQHGTPNFFICCHQVVCLPGFWGVNGFVSTSSVLVTYHFTTRFPFSRKCWYLLSYPLPFLSFSSTYF